ncbi:MAG: hypothetical protein H6753_03405 [Candidatus Omnitrophica bacterium]|nr:hypothetical protein [Candidatus Omnitrophota bacterium]
MFEQLIPLHPKLVHFPIALFVTALGFEVFALLLRKERLHQTAMYLFVVAALASVVVVRSGIWEQARLHLNHPLLTQHRMWALWTMGFSLAALPVLWISKVFLSKYFRFVFLIILLAVVGLVSFTAHHGGRMVYEYGVGVEN